MKKIVNFKYVSTEDAKTVKIKNIPKYKGILYPSLLDHQLACLEKLGNSRHVSISMPTGSGKSVIILTHAYNLLKKESKAKVIIVAPQRVIVRNFDSYCFTLNGEPVSFNPIVLNSDNNVKELRWFLEAKVSKDYISGRVLACTHASIVKLFSSLSEAERSKLFKNVCVWFDEAHHISSTEYTDRDLLRNGLSDIAHYLLRTNNRIGLATATLFRSDRTAIIEKEYTDKFNTFKYSYVDYINSCKYLKGLVHYTYMYDSNRKDVVKDILSRKKKGYGTIAIYIPNARSKHMECKYEEVNNIIKLAKEYDLSIIDLVHEKTQRKNIEILSEYNANCNKYMKDILSGKKSRKPNPKNHIDVIVALNMGKEGFDFLPIDTVIILEDRGSLNEVVQTIGRSLRDYKHKKKVSEIYHIMPSQLFYIDSERACRLIDINIAALSLSLMMEDIFTPLLKSGGKGKKTNHVVDYHMYDQTIYNLYNHVIHTIIKTIPEDIPIPAKWNILTSDIDAQLIEQGISNPSTRETIRNMVKRRIGIRCYGNKLLKLLPKMEHIVDITDIGIRYISNPLGYSSLASLKYVRHPNGYLPYEQAQAIVHKLQFETIKEYRQYIRSSRKTGYTIDVDEKDRELIQYLPLYPESIYKGKGWIDAKRYLGTKLTLSREVAKDILVMMARAGFSRPSFCSKHTEEKYINDIKSAIPIARKYSITSGSLNRFLSSMYRQLPGKPNKYYDPVFEAKILDANQYWFITHIPLDKSITLNIPGRKNITVNTIKEFILKYNRLPRHNGQVVFDGFPEKKIHSKLRLCAVSKSPRDLLGEVYDLYLEYTRRYSREDIRDMQSIILDIAKCGGTKPRGKSKDMIGRFREKTLEKRLVLEREKNTAFHKKVKSLRPDWYKKRYRAKDLKPILLEFIATNNRIPSRTGESSFKGVPESRLNGALHAFISKRSVIYDKDLRKSLISRNLIKVLEI